MPLGALNKTSDFFREESSIVVVAPHVLCLSLHRTIDTGEMTTLSYAMYCMYRVCTCYMCTLPTVTL